MLPPHRGSFLLINGVNNLMSKLRILSIDGGGIRGIIPISIIHRLCSFVNVPGKVDLLAGTSTGGLISLALAKGLTPSEIKNIYIKDGKRIFSDNIFDDIKDLFTLTGADYSIENLELVLKEIFGEQKLKQLNKLVMVTAFDLDNEASDKSLRTWQPKLFGNLPIHGYDVEVPAYKAALYTAAAPIFFPSVDGCIDGGVFAVNPSVFAVCEAVAHLKIPLDEIVLLSISTGISRKYIKGNDHDWGYAQWVKPLMNMMIDGESFSADESCCHLLGDRYFRIAPVFPEGVNVSMDDADKIDYMVNFAESLDLNAAETWLKKYWE